MLPIDDNERKAIKPYDGFIAYFPNAIWEVAKVSHMGSVQHHPDEPMHHDPKKSPDEKNSLVRHMLDEAMDDGTNLKLLKAKQAWRAMMDLERLCKAEAKSKASATSTITESNLPVDLAEFLRSEGCLDEFVVELAGKALPKNGCDWIATAFTWQDAPSGRDFWFEVDNRWLAHLNAMDKEDE
jgi:hypothetical protein